METNNSITNSNNSISSKKRLHKLLFIIVLSLFVQMSAQAHASWQQHADDMYDVFGFERKEELTKWMKFVSSFLIDNQNADCAFSDNSESFNFYLYLQEKYPPFQCKHRLLFHWGYNSRPWSIFLQEKVLGYGWTENMIQDFQADLIAEQKRRNRFANEYTENVFGFAHSGKEARIARVIISIAYDVHLLGDYEPDNTDLDGLQDFESVVGDIINNLNALDKQRSLTLSKQMRKVSQTHEYDVQNKATIILDLLKKNFSILFQTAKNGEIAKHLNNHNIFFDNNTTSPFFEVKKTSMHKNCKKEDIPRTRNGQGIVIVIFFSLLVLAILFVLLFKKIK